MNPFTLTDLARCWAGLASLGAGLVSFALAREQVGVSATVCVALLLAGCYQLAWAVAALRSSRTPLPRLTVLLNGTLLALWAALGASLLGALLSLLVVAGVLAAKAGLRPTAYRSAGGYLTALAAGSLLVAALTTPALAATEAGEHARPHGGSHTR